jgi:translation initiation factor 5
MATLMNINGEVDTFQRYKMPKLEMRFNEGRKRTYITNLVKVCESLNRELDIVSLFIKKKLSTSVSWKKKQEELELGGIYKGTYLQELIQDLITEYILCRECNNPETELRLKSNGNSLSMKCAACGQRSVIKNQDIVFDGIMKLFQNRTAKKKKLKKNSNSDKKI